MGNALALQTDNCFVTASHYVQHRLPKMGLESYQDIRPLEVDLQVLRFFVLYVRQGKSNRFFADEEEDIGIMPIIGDVVSRIPTDLNSAYLTSGSGGALIEVKRCREDIKFFATVINQMCISLLANKGRYCSLGHHQRLIDVFHSLSDCLYSLSRARPEFKEVFDYERLKFPTKFIENFIGFATVQGVDRMQLIDLSTQLEAAAGNAASMIYKTWFDRDRHDGQELKRKQFVEIGQLLQKIMPVFADPQLREAYIQILTASKLSKASTHIFSRQKKNKNKEQKKKQQKKEQQQENWLKAAKEYKKKKKMQQQQQEEEEDGQQQQQEEEEEGLKEEEEDGQQQQQEEEEEGLKEEEEDGQQEEEEEVHGLEVAKKFIHSLLYNLTELLQCYTSIALSVDDQMQKLHQGLRFLSILLVEKHKVFTALDDEARDLIGAVVIDAGILVCSLSLDELKRGLTKESHLALSHWLRVLEFIMSEVIQIHPPWWTSSSSSSSFPKTNELGYFDSLLQHLEELVSTGAYSIDLLKDQFHTVKDDLASLKPFLENIAEQRYQNSKLQTLWDSVMEVAHKAEFAIDSIIYQVNDKPDCPSMSLGTIITKEINSLKAKVLDSTRNADPSDQRVTKTSIHMPSEASASASAPKFNEFLAGLYDEQNTIIDGLTRGSDGLKIISIVGMPGLGKTTLATKVYNDSQITHHFHFQAWCTVSQVYCKHNLLLQIMGDANRYRNMEVNDLAL